MSKKIMVRDRQGHFQSLVVELGADSLQYVAKSQNEKTGILPTQFIGASREESESTCRICPLWKDNTCYAQDGSPQMGHSSLLGAVRRGFDRGLDQALENCHKDSMYLRMGAIGDPGSITPEVYQEHEAKAREWGFGVISYTHQWYLEHAQHLKGRALASCDNAKDVKDAVNAGWRTAVHIDESDSAMFGSTMAEKPQGSVNMGGTEVNYFFCPAQRSHNAVKCNDCGLCDGTKPMANGYNTIVFIEHGNQMLWTKQRKRRAAEAAALAVPTVVEALEPVLIQLDTSTLRKKGTVRMA